MEDSGTARAFADEVRAEMARQHRTARWVQAQVGMSSSAYQKYFVQQTRPIPSDVQLAVCRALGVRSSEMWRRAEDRADAQSDDPVDSELLSGMSPRNRRLAEELSPKPAPKPKPERRMRRTS